ncbi:cytochrome P450 [Lentinula aciculospora]|uniref:Cytochrome P450 n=1 Tax=Lentinula aciculospora TaxID=153920 RepID=A0A9W9A4P0_9AGAR|nr:cytochrome P450 [Lentinula aciculospora]
MSSSFKPGENAFRFHLFGNFVIGVRGQEARKMFFSQRHFSTTEGYKMFSKAVPVPELTKTLVSAEEEHGLSFKKQLEVLVNRKRLTAIISTMLCDTQTVVASWKDEGSIDPFDRINDITFLVFAHMVTSSDFVSETRDFSRFQDQFFTQLRNNTPAMIFMPWFYRRAQHEKEVAVTSLFAKLTTYIEAREKSKASASEPIDLLLNHGLNTHDIIQFILGFLFGGVYNTTKAISWILIYISIHPQWKSAIRFEVDGALTGTSVDSSKPLHSQLADVTTEAWENSMPTLDLIISETFRLVMNQTVLRRNMGEDVKLPGGQGHISNGTFVVYSHADAHLKSETYTEPWAFKPDRFKDGKQKVTNDFLGWGAGRHRCVGMRIAKLTIKIIVCLFVMTYDYDITRKKRKFSSAATIPIPDHNKVNDARPKGESIILKYKRIVV